MRARIESGPGAPWEGEAEIKDEAIWIDGEPYCAYDNLEGIVIVVATQREQALLAEAGFKLPTTNVTRLPS